MHRLTPALSKVLRLPRGSATPAARQGRAAYHASVLPSLVQTGTPEFAAKAKAMEELVADLDEKLKLARQGGGEKAAERMKSKGKLLPRER